MFYYEKLNKVISDLFVLWLIHTMSLSVIFLAIEYTTICYKGYAGIRGKVNANSPWYDIGWCYSGLKWMQLKKLQITQDPTSRYSYLVSSSGVVKSCYTTPFIQHLPVYNLILCIGWLPILEPKKKFFLFFEKNFGWKTYLLSLNFL